ncbi:hypothetical protein NHE_0756 [Neorickettsia helminthoeca str. Oregon]|uniref:Uncharacterized protein n=1 Tax=Neorickettsia helminthoeca str. Oregon TaxID=1286528 RepID=X5H4Q2_9RICK|nr:hypothetical protein [Neorickettsia helminthoeca]AHX11688.1 hypothetical protein NHE_0756 [Neorickettsia helminthoeca str. Oregon]
MRLILLLFYIFATAGLANANPILEYFLTMSYVEGGMTPCSEISKQLQDEGKKRQLTQVLALALGAIQNCGTFANADKVTEVLDGAVAYCNLHPNTIFSMALVNAIKPVNITSFRCSASTVRGDPAQSSDKEISSKSPKQAERKKNGAQKHSSKTSTRKNEDHSKVIIID